MLGLLVVSRRGWIRRPGSGSAQPGDERGADEIPPEELAAAAGEVLRVSLALPEEEALVRATARRFGIQRVGKKVVDGSRGRDRAAVERGRGTAARSAPPDRS